VTKEGSTPEGKGGVGRGKGSRHQLNGPKVRQLKGKGKAKEVGDVMDHREIWSTKASNTKHLQCLQPFQAIVGKIKSSMNI